MTFGKIAARYKASHKRYKAYFVIIVCINLIGWAVINFAVSENVFQLKYKGSLHILSLSVIEKKVLGDCKFGAKT